MFTIGNVMIEEWQRTACPTSIPNKILSISDLSVSNPWIGWFVWNRQSLQADDVRGEWVSPTCRAHWTCCSTCPWLPPQAWSPYRYIYLYVNSTCSSQSFISLHFIFRFHRAGAASSSLLPILSQIPIFWFAAQLHIFPPRSKFLASISSFCLSKFPPASISKSQ